MAENNSSAPLKTAELPLAVRTAPERIWLDLGVEEAEHINFADLEVTWSDDNATGRGIAYVRADTQAVEAQAPAAVAVPAGWKLVPIEPTPAMLDAAARASLSHLLECIHDPSKADKMGSEEMIKLTHASRYRSMLAATPALPATEDSSAGDLVEVQVEPVARMDDGSLRSGSTATAHRVVTAETKAGMPRAASESFNTPLYTAPQAQPADALDAETIKKAARYDWLRRNVGVYRTDYGKGAISAYLLSRVPASNAIAEGTDLAIDAAMAAAQEGGNAAKEA